MKRNVEDEISRNNTWYTDDQFAWAEEPFIKPIYDKRKSFLLQAMGTFIQRRPISILDCGCGDGYWSSFMSKLKDVTIIGIDYNELRLTRAKQNAPSVTFALADINNMRDSFSEKFDLIWLSQVIEHVEDDRLILSSCYSLLNDDGVLILGTTHEGNWLYKPKLLLTDYKKNSDHVHFYTLREISQKIEDSGFKIVDSLYEPFFPLSEKVFYWCMKRRFFRNILELLANRFPFGCTDFYFTCKKK